MGQKIHPTGFRIGPKYSWTSRWMAKKNQYAKTLLEDVQLRGLLIEKLKTAGIAKVEIERSIGKINLIIHVSRPGMIIGRGGQGLQDLKKFIMSNLKITDEGKIDIRVEEIKKPDLNAYLVAKSVADQLAKRMPARRVMHQTVEKVMKSGAKGVKVLLTGRIGGADIARREQLKDGSIPLQTLRADIDFAEVPSLTKSGYIGVKVWINKGED